MRQTTNGTRKTRTTCWWVPDDCCTDKYKINGNCRVASTDILMKRINRNSRVDSQRPRDLYDIVAMASSPLDGSPNASPSRACAEDLFAHCSSYIPPKYSTLKWLTAGVVSKRCAETGVRCRLRDARVGCLHIKMEYLDKCKRKLKAPHCRNIIHRVLLPQLKRRLPKLGRMPMVLPTVRNWN